MKNFAILEASLLFYTYIYVNSIKILTLATLLATVQTVWRVQNNFCMKVCFTIPEYRMSSDR